MIKNVFSRKNETKQNGIFKINACADCSNFPSICAHAVDHRFLRVTNNVASLISFTLISFTDGDNR